MAANAYLATKISNINAMAEVCEAVGADIRTVAGVLGHDQRIGRHGLDAGIGFGGGCPPKDLHARTTQAATVSAAHAAALLREIDRINLHRPCGVPNHSPHRPQIAHSVGVEVRAWFTRHGGRWRDSKGYTVLTADT